ncbi:MAG: hypothetical protein ACQETH_02380 [Candidatus Rifleibacteriota bacterium]
MSMKRAFIFAVLLTCCLGFAAPLAGQTPGTAGDPLVSKSYLDHFFRFKSYVLKEKELLRPEPGALIIVRSGEISIEGPEGKTVIDLTQGKEIKMSSVLPLNHLIIIPDSSEFVFKTKKQAIILASCLQEK